MFGSFGQLGTRAPKIHIFPSTSTHICPWHLKVTLVVVIEWKIVFMIRSRKRQTNYYCVRLCQPSSEQWQTFSNGGSGSSNGSASAIDSTSSTSSDNAEAKSINSRTIARMCQCAYQVYTWFILVFVVKSVPFSRAHRTLTIQQCNIKWQTFIYGPS